MNGLRRLLILPASVLVFAALPVAAQSRTAAQEQQAERLFFYSFDERFDLVYDREAIAVQHGEVPARGVLEDLRDVLPDLVLHEELGAWTLFSLPNASEAAESGSVGVLEAIAALAREVTSEYFFSPLFGSGEYRSVIDGTVIVAFDRNEVPAFAEEVLADAGIEIRDRDFARMKNVYRGTFSSMRSGLDVLESANTLALLDSVRYSEPSFIVFSGGSSCVPLLPLPTGPELSRSGAFLGPYDPQSGSYGINAIAAWDQCGGSDGSGPAITVGIAGDGVEKIHPDLDANVRLPSNPATVADFSTLAGCDVPGLPDDGTPKHNCDYHETMVAGVIGMVSGTNFGVGAAPEVRLAPARAACNTEVSPPRCFGMLKRDDFAAALDFLALVPASQDGPEAGVVNLRAGTGRLPRRWWRTSSRSSSTRESS